jgi:hypothetical protein
MQPHRQPPQYPPQQPYGQPPPQWGPPPRQPKRTSPAVIVLAVIGGVLGLGLVIGGAMALLGSGQEETPNASNSSAAAVAGIPPEPDQKTRAVYIADLKKIDPAIVDDEEQAVDRGRNQCSSIKDFPGDEAKLVDLTNKRFTAPSHPDGFGKAKATKILAAVRKHLCPTY